MKKTANHWLQHPSKQQTKSLFSVWTKELFNSKYWFILLHSSPQINNRFLVYLAVKAGPTKLAMATLFCTKIKKTTLTKRLKKTNCLVFLLFLCQYLIGFIEFVMYSYRKIDIELENWKVEKL